jgi:8-oxo-dGTP pyrophosphatase MutT (NUDIX family)
MSEYGGHIYFDGHFIKMHSTHNIIKAAGGLLWRETSEGRELVLVHRPRYDDWTLPKGKLNAGEDWIDAAIREVEEEAGCIVDCASFAGTIRYVTRKRPKEVRYWHMNLVEERKFIPNSEIDRLMWLPVDQAVELLSYTHEKELLKKFRA